MKRIICLLLIAAFISTSALSQKNYDSSQKKLMESVLSFLRSEGYQPSIDSDGDIKFKRQGETYYVIISDKDTSPMYVRLSKFYSYGEKATKAKVAQYANEINLYKMCKLMLRDDSYIIDFQMFLNSASSFTSVFNKMIDIMDLAEIELLKLVDS